MCSAVTNHAVSVSSGSREKKTKKVFEKVLNITMNEKYPTSGKKHKSMVTRN